MIKKKAVMGLSGGMDSSTLLGWLLRENYEVHACIFSYGSKHNKYENAAAHDVVNFYLSKNEQINIHHFDFSNLTTNSKSALLLSGEEIPEGHFNDEVMKKTVVPGRNLMFISIMAGLAESIGAEVVALGVHAGDHQIYPDCREDFIQSASLTVYLSTDRKVRVIAPFQHLDKSGILLRGMELWPHVPYFLTRTCYKDQPISCGKCGSCRERIEAFQVIGWADPISYV